MGKCNFVSLRDKKRCDNQGTICCGDKYYCSTHSRTSQALQVKREYEEHRIEPEPSPSKRKKIPRRESDEDENDDDESSGRKVTKIKDIKKSKDLRGELQSKLKQEKSYSSSSAAVSVPTSSKKDVLKLKQNKWGRYEEPLYNIVFDPKTKCAIGYEHPNKKKNDLLPLDEFRIKECKKRGWSVGKLKLFDEDDDNESNDNDRREYNKKRRDDDEDEEDEYYTGSEYTASHDFE